MLMPIFFESSCYYLIKNNGNKIYNESINYSSFIKIALFRDIFVIW